MKSWFRFQIVFLVFSSMIFGSLGAVMACGQEYVCREGLVRFSRHLNQAEIEVILKRFKAQTIRYYPRTRFYHLAFTPEQNTLQQVLNFTAEPMVLKALPNFKVSASALPDDTHFNLLWGLHNIGQSGGSLEADIGMDEVWDQFTDGSQVVVAVIDSGIDYDHPDLMNNMWVNAGEIPDNGIDDDGNGYIDDVYGYDFVNNDSDPFDDYHHGTHVAGIIGAVGNNATGVVGVNWQAKLMALKFLNEAGNGDLSDALAALEYALDNGATVLNNSWGGPSTSGAFFEIVLESDVQGTIFVAAAGNNGRDTDEAPFYPAALDSPNLLSIAATTRFDTLWGSSNFGGTTVDFAAPGASIYSTYPNEQYGYISGTSMSTAYVSGAAALLWSQYPALSHRQIIHVLLQSSLPKVYLAGKTVMGSVLYLPAALDILADPDNHAPVANAGPDQMKQVGELVSLSGNAIDEDGDFPLIFEWELVSPPDSNAQLEAPVSQGPNFRPDVEGTYQLNLVVSDTLSMSVPDTLTVEVNGFNVPLPTANISAKAKDPISNDTLGLGAGQTVPLGWEVKLDANGTSSVFPEQLILEWQWITRPSGSQAEFANFDQVNNSFFVDQEGVYTIRLLAEDGFGESSAEFSLVAATQTNASDEVVPGPSEEAPPTSVRAAGCSLIH